jgi:hypothetical protein
MVSRNFETLCCHSSHVISPGVAAAAGHPWLCCGSRSAVQNGKKWDITKQLVKYVFDLYIYYASILYINIYI